MSRVRRRFVLAPLIVLPVAVAAVACSSPEAAVTSSASTSPAGTTGPTTTDGPKAPAAPEPPAFSATVSAVTAAELGTSWRPGCPVGPEALRRLGMTHWGFDNQAHHGALVVHRDVADAVVAIFQRLYEQRFPIRRMEPIAAFGGDDPASMAADNTSGFNCRNAVAAGPPRWSVHAYGKAIDVNPVENPYLEGGRVQPPAGGAFLDRSEYRPGMAVKGGPLTSAFAAEGWDWGGEWEATPDYQHFSAIGG